MNNLLYTAAVVLIVLWAVGYFGYHADAYIHLFIALAAVLIVVRLVFGKRGLFGRD
jgi:hypothetical protein